MSGLYGDLDVAKLMFGNMAVHVPAWFVVQAGCPESMPVSFVGASRNHALTFGADETHILVVGELVVRPHLIVASNKFIGSGLGGLITTTPDEWIHERIIYNYER